MLTPQQNLEEADRLLQVIQDAVGSHKALTVADTIALANSRISLALAFNAVPLMGEFRDDYTELRGPAKID